MVHSFSRLELQLGIEQVNKLRKSTIVVLGVGGVGSFATEALARSAIGRIILVDHAIVDITNINRQIPALSTTIGQSKVELMKERILDINPECEVIPLQLFYDETTMEQIFSYQPDYVIDAIDTIGSKILTMVECKKRNIPLISSMGAGNKLDPTQFQVVDISKTHMDPVAKVIRHELKKHGITKGIQVVFSPEQPLTPHEELYKEIGDPNSEIRKEKTPPSSNSFVSPAAGLIMASVVVRDLISKVRDDQ
ncbi:tRNA threonylcarbamoyladenosine dehydratase [Tepidibacillus fermentans]|uniref:tRNA A37 threonylcarbamoyladenosine dehydratase n=1 Tax=Tepidibacillus fermentans TaxID=1281767 RepID=A0A4R3KKP4_9BACI|nr:tRNA threonylcarbamoyladenosine dehydratase [Tepidibacillus fermentans]TCS83821.1 tRNA A37 threonylcarbamoyladenosine dehydratase [Tepidibacillus fermentans]